MAKSTYQSDRRKYFDVSRAHRCFVGERETSEGFDVVIRPLWSGASRASYYVEKNAPRLTGKELALICAGGDLRFGYSKSGNCIDIFTSR